jgi:hypothetical protein
VCLDTGPWSVPEQGTPVPGVIHAWGCADIAIEPGRNTPDSAYLSMVQAAVRQACRFHSLGDQKRGRRLRRRLGDPFPMF